MAYAYNLAGDLVQAKVQEQALSPMSRTYQYHVSGDLSSTYTNSGRKISYSGFDSYGRLVKSRVLVGANVHYTDESAYDKGLNGVGRLTGMWRKDANGNLLKKSAYAYTNRGLPEYYESFIKATGATYGVSFGYNEGAMLKGLVYPNGQSVSYTYNPDGTALRVDDDKTGLPIATVTEYNARRQPVRISFANESGDEYYYHYNPCGNVDALNVYNDSVLVRSESIVYRDNGEIASITDEINGQTQSMDYDFAGRLSSWITTGPLGQTTEEYLYDGLSSSEMTASIRNGVVTERHYTLANNPWAVSETVVNGIANSYSYDSDGNLLGIPAFTYAYDAEGKLATATKRGSTTTWNYGPGGELYHKNTVGPLGSNRVEYIGELYERRSVDGDRTKEEEICHVMLGGMRIAAIVNQAKGGSFILRMHGDRLDSVDSIQNYDGSQLRSARYYPFGELLSSSGTTVLDEFQFNGRRNEGFGFLRFPARIYIPSLKQWSSLDPLVMSAPNVMVRVGISPYAYVDNEPIGKIDLFGLDPTTIFGAPSGGSFGDILGGPPGPAFYNIGPPAIVNPLNADGVDTTQYWDMSPAEVARLGQGGNRIEGKKKWKPPYMGEKLPHFNVSSENEMLGFQEDMFGWGPLASMAVHLWWLIESKDILGRPVARSHAAVLVGGDVFDGALWYMSCATGGAGRAAGGARAAAQQAPNVVKGLGNITHAGKLTPDVALSAAQRWLGPGYRELAPGVYRSVDNLRQFRMVTSDLVGAHGKIGPHVHFQAFDDLGVVVENLHVPIFP
jgi:RHS repeat-associated protein